MSDKYVDVVFDGPPGPEAGRFVEVENEAGASIRFGEWLARDDGYWALRIPSTEAKDAEIERLKDELDAERYDSMFKDKEIERLQAEMDEHCKAQANCYIEMAKLQAVVDAAQRYADAELDPVLWDALAALEGGDDAQFES